MATTENTLTCIVCKKRRPGRFIRSDIPGSLHQKGKPHLPRWTCFSCLPEGSGTAEVLPAKTVSITVPQHAPTKEEGLALLNPLEAEVQALAVVQTPEQYERADNALARIQKARRTWGDRMARIIQPIRKGLDALYELNRDVDKPLERLELRVKGAMKAFKERELQALRAAEEERMAEEQRLQEELAAKRRAEELARTPQMRGKAVAAQHAIEEQIQAAQQVVPPEPVRGMASTVRVPKKWRLKNDNAFFELVAAVMDSKAPPEAIQLNEKFINSLFRERPDVVASWPGIELYDDIQIVGRG